MSMETVSPEKLAMLVQYYSEALAPDFGLRPGASPEWGDIPPRERSRMIAATRLALLDLRHANLYRISGELPPVAEFAGGSEGKECGC
jgi:hypothetical protein